MGRRAQVEVVLTRSPRAQTSQRSGSTVTLPPIVAKHDLGRLDVRATPSGKSVGKKRQVLERAIEHTGGE